MESTWYVNNLSVEAEERFVCSECGFVLRDAFAALHLIDHLLFASSVQVDKGLVKFLEKVKLQSNIPFPTLQQQMTKRCHYAIALTCLHEGDEKALAKLSPFLPKSNVVWARNMDLMNPMPMIFAWSWLKNLKQSMPSRDLSKRQKKRFYQNLKNIDRVERKTMYDLINCHGLEDGVSSEVDLEMLPLSLRHVLYRFSMAVKKRRVSCTRVVRKKNSL